jgi:putative phosphoesterase
LLSDSHGRASTTRRAVAALLKQGIDRLIHLGDVGTVDVIDALAVEHPDTDDQIEAHVIFGNTDWDIAGLTDYARDLDISVDHPTGRLKLDQAELVYCHGDNQQAMDQAIADQATYLCHGHTHRVQDERVEQTRIINPGALFRAKTYTVAVLDTAEDSVQFLTVDGA